MPVELQAVVLVGGQGSRVRHVLGDMPKPLAPVCGRPFVEWLLRHFRNTLGIEEFVLATGNRSEIFESHLPQESSAPYRTLCVAEPEPLGTAGGFLHCVEALPERCPDYWLVANGDSLTVSTYAGLPEMLADQEVYGILVAVEVDDASRFGTVICDDTWRLRGFREKGPGRGLINAGLYFFSDRLVRRFPRRRPLSLEFDVLPWLAAEAYIRVLPVNAPFIDIGTESSLAEAESFVRRHVLADRLDGE
ncbi:MAG TPA: sugar phosphate nucleotidyltransferase [Acidobacteriota bacterium]|nr:sugar phosphate nucleotidyltransferase [Acidobacteriota bacterium]